MTATTNTDWLLRYVLAESGMGDCECVHRGDGRAVVTDRVCVLAVDDPAATFAPLELRPGVAVVNSTVRRAFAEQVPADAMRTDLADLWLWLDRLDMVRCADCLSLAGAAWCDECDGRGWVRPDSSDTTVDTVVLADRFVDRWRLVRWLPGELETLGTDVAVWRCGAFNTKDVVTIDGGGWRLITMSLDPTTRRGQTFRTYYPDAGLWWQHRRDPVARMSAVDWFADRGIGVDEAVLFGGDQ